MAKDYNSAKSNTSPSVKPGSSGGEASEGAADGPGDPIRDIVIGGKAPGIAPTRVLIDDIFFKGV